MNSELNRARASIRRRAIPDWKGKFALKLFVDRDCAGTERDLPSGSRVIYKITEKRLGLSSDKASSFFATALVGNMTMTGQWSRDASTPPFIDLVPIEQATGARKEFYDEMERLRGSGRVSNLFKAYAAFPALAKANFQRLMVLLNQGTLSVKFKEALMTALAEANKCDYCVSFHATALRNAGASDEEVVAALEFDPDRIGLSGKEKALFNYALKANGDPHSIVAADIEELRRKGASDWDLIETLETVNTGNSFNLINGALNVGPDDFLNYMKGRGELWKKSA